MKRMVLLVAVISTTAYSVDCGAQTKNSPLKDITFKEIATSETCYNTNYYETLRDDIKKQKAYLVLYGEKACTSIWFPYIREKHTITDPDHYKALIDMYWEGRGEPVYTAILWSKIKELTDNHYYDYYLGFKFLEGDKLDPQLKEEFTIDGSVYSPPLFRSIAEHLDLQPGDKLEFVRAGEGGKEVIFRIATAHTTEGYLFCDYTRIPDKNKVADYKKYKSPL